MSDEESPDEALDQGTVPIQVQVQPHVGSGKSLRIETRCSSHERLNGFLLGLSDQLGLMHCFHDFMPDGYTVFRLADVISVRSNQYERHWDRMLAGEGLLTGLHQILHVDLNTIPTAIDTISSQFQLMIIEVEVPEEGIEEFYVGQAVSWDEESVQFDEFDALGQWESESSTIALDEIAFIQFDTPYIKTFRKYLNRPPSTYDK